MNKKISVGAALSLMAIVAAITFVIANTVSLNVYNRTVSNVMERAEVYKKLDEIDAFVRDNYNGELNETTLSNALANGYIASLGDSYAEYLTANAYSRIKLERQGVSRSVGVVLENTGGYALITEVLDNSSAKSEGLKVGEYIVKVNGVDLLAGGYDACVAKLSGEIGSTVMVTVRNADSDRDVMLTRSELSLRSVEGIMYNDIAHITISDFTDKTPSQFSDILDLFIENGANALVIDVRNVSSNHLQPCIDILSTLLPQGEFVYSVKQDGSAIPLGSSVTDGPGLPVAVLANGKTGGAGELMASALCTVGQAVLIGTETQGRGVVEEYFECLDGSGICISTGVIRVGTSEIFDIIGLKPNYEVTLADDSPEAIESLNEQTDAQLKKAIEYLSATTGNAVGN